MPAAARDVSPSCPKNILLVIKLICGTKMEKLIGNAIESICRLLVVKRRSDAGAAEDIISPKIAYYCSHQYVSFNKI